MHNKQGVKFAQRTRCQIRTTSKVSNLPTQQSVKLAQQLRCQNLRDKPSVKFSHPGKYQGAVHNIRTKECNVSTLTFGRRPLGLSAYQSNRPEKDNRRDRSVESRASLRPPPPLLHHNPMAWDSTGRDHTNQRLRRAPRGSPGLGDATGECGRRVMIRGEQAVPSVPLFFNQGVQSIV